MMITAIEHPGPAAIRYPRGNGQGVDISAAPKVIEIGKGEVLRKGTDGAVVAYGSMVYPAMQAAEKLAKSGVNICSCTPDSSNRSMPNCCYQRLAKCR